MTEQVAVVTGTTRGLGRGVARALGSKGMTVYVTGRDADALDAVAAEVSAAGGRSVAVRCDHADDAQIEALFERVRGESGQLHLLVNNAAAVYRADLSRPVPFWEKDLRLADMITVGLRSDYVAAYYAAPLMVESGRGLIANISFYGAVTYFASPAYGAAKAGTDKMTHDMAIDFAGTGVSVLSLWPGYILTDELRAADAALAEAERPSRAEFETPEFTGLVAAALLADPALKALSGSTLIVAQAAKRYGIRDLGGNQPGDWTVLLGQPATYFARERPATTHVSRS